MEIVPKWLFDFTAHSAVNKKWAKVSWRVSISSNRWQFKQMIGEVGPVLIDVCFSLKAAGGGDVFQSRSVRGFDDSPLGFSQLQSCCSTNRPGQDVLKGAVMDRHPEQTLLCLCCVSTWTPLRCLCPEKKAPLGNCVLPPNQCGNLWTAFSPLCMVGVWWGACKSQATATFMFTVFALTLDRRPGWLSPTLAHRRAPAYTSAPESTPQRWAPSPWCLLFVLTFQGQRALSAHRPPRPTRHWVMEHLLMFVKGHQDEKETQRLLNTKPMVSDAPIHHCLPWATSFRLPFHHWIVRPPGWFLVD